jgi:hypothetical protein
VGHAAIAGAFWIEKGVQAAATASITQCSFRATAAPLCSVGASLRDDGDPVSGAAGEPLTIELTGSTALGARGLGV